MNAGLQDAYRQGRKRLLLFDYDGTLREIESTPEQAAPTPEIKQILRDLANATGNTLVIVSGRDHETLERWFGDLPLYFVAEHGMAYRGPGQDWQFASAPPADWQAPVRELLDKSVAALPGSLIETKPNSLVWHYRVAEQTAVAAQRAALLAELSPLAKQYRLRVLASEMSKAVDVQPEGNDKGRSVRRWFDLGDFDFILAVGDDLTDEDLFRAMPSHAFTVKVGEEETAAKDSLPDPAAVRRLLSKLASAG